MKKIIFIISIMCSLLSAKGQTLDSYLKLAVDSNPGLKASYHEFEAALQQIPQVKVLPDPTITISAFGQMVETRVGPQRAIFILQQMFPWFGTLKTQGEATALMAEAKFIVWLDSRNELMYDVKAAWYPLYELDEMIKYQKEQNDILETYKRLALSKFKNGEGTMVDVIRTDILIDEVQTELKLLENKRKPLLARFNSQINREMDSPVEVTEMISPNETPPLYSADSILKDNPRLTEIDKKIEAWQLQQRVASKQGMPVMGVGLNYTVIGKRSDVDIPDNGKDAIMPMVTLSIPIHRNKYKAAVKEATFMQSALMEKKDQLANSILAAYEMSQYESLKSFEEYKLATLQQTKTKQVVSLLLSSYSNSSTDITEILRMQQMLLKYKITAVSANTNYYIAMARLNYLTTKTETR